MVSVNVFVDDVTVLWCLLQFQKLGGSVLVMYLPKTTEEKILFIIIRFTSYFPLLYLFIF